jgi:hypothetical protein
MRILSLLFVLVIVVSFNSFAQSKGCSKEKECVVKTCDEGKTQADVIIKNDEKTKGTVDKKQTNKVSGEQVKTKPTKVVDKKKN